MKVMNISPFCRDYFSCRWSDFLYISLNDSKRFPEWNNQHLLYTSLLIILIFIAVTAVTQTAPTLCSRDNPKTCVSPTSSASASCRTSCYQNFPNCPVITSQSFRDIFKACSSSFRNLTKHFKIRFVKAPNIYIYIR